MQLKPGNTLYFPAQDSSTAVQHLQDFFKQMLPRTTLFPLLSRDHLNCFCLQIIKIHTQASLNNEESKYWMLQ